MGMEPVNQVAKVSFNEELGRYELHIGNLKAYSEGADEATHLKGKAELVRMAKDKGYTVIEG